MTKYYYVYQCAPSSETRGRRADHDKGCGHWAVRMSRTDLSAHWPKPVQTKPCKKCGKRQRLNWGTVRVAPNNLTHDSDLIRYTSWADAKAWADREARQLNLRDSLTTSEESNQTQANSEVTTHQNEVTTHQNEVTTHQNEVTTNDEEE